MLYRQVGMKYTSYLPAYEDGPDSVPKRRHLKFIRRGITQKKAYNGSWLNPLTPNDHYSGRTAPLTSKRCILYIYSTNIGADYFKHGI